MKRLAFVMALVGVMAAQALPIKPNQGEGKYRFCQRMYDSCMSGVFGTPGSQGYNVGRARCYGKWTSCRKTGTWTASYLEESMDSAYDVGLGTDAADEMELLEE